MRHSDHMNSSVTRTPMMMSALTSMLPPYGEARHERRHVSVPLCSYPMRGDCGSRTQPCTVLQTVANPVGVIADGVPFRTLGRTPAPLPDRPVPVWRETEKPSCRNRRAPYVSIEAREKKPRIPYGLHSETEEGLGVPEWDWCGSPPRIRTSSNGSKDRCAAVTPAGNSGAC